MLCVTAEKGNAGRGLFRSIIEMTKSKLRADGWFCCCYCKHLRRQNKEDMASQ